MQKKSDKKVVTDQMTIKWERKNSDKMYRMGVTSVARFVYIKSRRERYEKESKRKRERERERE